MKIESHVRICTKFVKSGVNKTIWHVNKAIGHVNKAMQSWELEISNKITKFADKDKQTSSV